MSQKLSESLEDYLEAIAELIAVDGHAHTKEIATRLNVKMPSVTGALRQLVELGYIEYSTRYPVRLTPAGRDIADRVRRRHRVLKTFFAEILGLPPQKASETACRLEHVVDEDTVRRFVLFSEAIANRSDAKSLQTYLTEAMGHLDHAAADRMSVLSELPIGASAAVAGFGRNLRTADGFGFAVGAVIAVTGIALDRTVFHIACDAGDFDLPRAAAENIWVKRL